MSMSEQVPKGVQAYRWGVSIGTAATTALAGLIFNTVLKTADDVGTLKTDVATMKATQVHQTSRIEAVERRNEEQDRKIDDVRREIYGFSSLPRRTP